jgi:hypothetical protein
MDGLGPGAQPAMPGAAIGGRQVEIQLAVRRFFRPAPDCAHITFAEQVTGLTTR